VLEWRADPASGWSNPHLARRDRGIALLCTHGFSSSLAAAALVDLGCVAAGDVVGGFEAWRGRTACATGARPRRRRLARHGRSGPMSAPNRSLPSRNAVGTLLTD
jgi:hypothetical protein